MGVIFKTAVKIKKTMNVIMLMDDREKFANDLITGLIRRMILCEKNNDKERKEVDKVLLRC